MPTEITETVESIEAADESPMSPEELQSGQAAFERLLSRLHAIPAAHVSSPRINLHRAAVAAVGVARKVNQPEMRSVFAELPPTRFDIALLDLLEPAAHAASFAYHEASTAEALATNAKLPAKLASDSAALRERMLKLIEFHLGDDETIHRIVADIRAGSGYLDTAADLSRLAKIYRENLDLLSRDPTHYVASDPDSADRMALEIDRLLGDGSTLKQNQQREIVARAWTLLNDTYEQIARPGRWLFHDKGGEKLFVSLITAARRPRTRAKAKAPEEATTTA
ncbi:MAG: hypothetical protein ACOX6T_19630 [Myxococcales bacterium]